jgi:fermentation-respiration switch protein FrsA (DUF1100 family)
MKKLLTTALLLLSSLAVLAAGFKAGLNRVTFTSEGEKMAGVLYLPADYQPGRKLPVIIAIGPFTQVKEQVAAVYAQKMAEAGFAAFAFDFRFWGESGGEPRWFESPADKLKDIRNAVTYLTTLPQLNANRIGIIGACFGAGYVAAAVEADARIKSWATVAAWINDEPALQSVFGAQTLAYRDSLSVAAGQQYARTGKMTYAPAYQPGNQKAAMFANLDYYGNPRRGAIPAWKNQYALISHKAWHEFSPLPIAPRIHTPALFVHSDGSALPETLRKLYASVQGPKELYWSKGEHTQFYDQPQQVSDAARAMVKHFSNTL